MPIFLHVTATDWLGETLPKYSWGTEDTIKFAKALAGQGTIDLIDISTRGVHAAQNVNFGPPFQAPFAVAVKQAVSNKLLVSAVGAITNGLQANDLLEKEGLDVALVGTCFPEGPRFELDFGPACQH